MRQCAACGSTNISRVNEDTDYSANATEYECMLCGHTGMVNHRGYKYWNFNSNKRPYKVDRDYAGKIG